MKNILGELAKAHAKEKKEDKKEKAEKEKPEDKVSVTHHVIEIGGIPLKFTATAGYMKMKDEEGKVKSKIFYVSYIKEGVKEKGERPITFCFNGGPGCASIWLHFAVIGPKKIQLGEKGEVLPPPYKLEDNVHTWLEFTDLVFIDPVGTGFSRHDKEEDPKQFYGVKEDVESVAEFIRLFTTRNERWTSAKFIAGESYGTTRAAGLSSYLQDIMGMDLNGLILLSSALDFQTLTFLPGNDLPYILYMPTYTATAWYHKKLSEEMLKKPLREVLDEVEEWVLNTYTPALIKGDRMTEKEKEAIIEKIAYYTGLSKSFILNCRMRVSQPRFAKELMREDRRFVARLDSRYLGMDTDPAGEAPEYDPSFFRGPFVNAVYEYVRTELKYQNDIPYNSIAFKVNSQWNFRSWSKINEALGGYTNMSESLASSMNQNQFLKVFFACGYYDLATPHFAAEYTVNHLGLEPEIRKNITVRHYEGGHMMYFHRPSMLKLREDIKEFYKS